MKKDRSGPVKDIFEVVDELVDQRMDRTLLLREIQKYMLKLSHKHPLPNFETGAELLEFVDRITLELRKKL